LTNQWKVSVNGSEGGEINERPNATKMNFYVLSEHFSTGLMGKGNGITLVTRKK